MNEWMKAWQGWVRWRLTIGIGNCRFRSSSSSLLRTFTSTGCTELFTTSPNYSVWFAFLFFYCLLDSKQWFIILQHWSTRSTTWSTRHWHWTALTWRLWNTVSSYWGNPIVFLVELMKRRSFNSVILSIIGLPILFQSHVYTVWIWFIVRQWETTEEHCGYDFPWNPSRLLPFYVSSPYWLISKCESHLLNQS